ncbi:MAG: hypothetical protein KJ077_40395 [Anaerolineae bacterium]|nr:hypothetical protein [Anaerolineae bacterium]
MPTIHAWQHIYSNVEKEQSPQRRGGFQTLFYTLAGLTSAEVEEMESRLLYFPSAVEPVKRLFFTTSTGKGVVAQIVVLPEPDQFGRKGRYLAHSLVFAPEALVQFEVDPFRVFHHFRFITTLNTALAQGNFQTGDIPAISLELSSQPTPHLEAARSWSRAELAKLTLLALRVKEQARQREAVTLAGEPAQIESALAAAFLGTPTALRASCTFDTYFYRCNLIATYFWAVGLPEPPASLKFALIEAATRQVQGTGPLQPETAYEHWVVAAIEAGQLAELARQRDPAFALAEWLEGRDYDSSLLEAVSPELITAMFKLNPERVQARLSQRVGEQMPPALVQRVADHLYGQTAVLELYRQLRQGFQLPQLLEALQASFAAEDFKQPSGAELKALETVLDQSEQPLFRLFLAYWRSPQRHLPRALEQADEIPYRQFGEIALRLKLVEPASLLRPGRVDAFLDLYLAGHVENLADLVEALLEMKELAALSRLTGLVRALPPKELKRLARLVKGRSGIPEPFQTAVQEAVAVLPEEGGLKGRLQAVWRRISS